MVPLKPDATEVGSAFRKTPLALFLHDFTHDVG